MEAPLGTESARARLIAFPYAAGSSICYQTLGQALPQGVSFMTYEIPGHGSRMREPLPTRLAAVVDDVIARVGECFDGQFAFFGHSYGAWLARDVTRRLAELGRPLPRYLFVSGRRAPLSRALGPILHRLPSPDFRARVAAWGGFPDSVLANEDMMKLFEALLRADLEALETRKQEPVVPLDLPIHVMQGLHDDVTDEQARDWQGETLRPLSLQYFLGGHFFFREHSPKVAAVIGKRLLEVASCPGVGSAD